MSDTYFKIIQIIEKYDDLERKELIDFYIETCGNEISCKNNTSKNTFILIMDLIKLTEKYNLPFEKVKNVVLNAVELKVLHLRAIILDTIEIDYSADIESFYGCEKWMKNIIKDLKHTICGSKEVYTLFCKHFLEECLNVFVSGQNKFGFYGNQLIVNFIYFRKYISKFTDYNFQSFFETLISHFEENKFYGFKEILNKLKINKEIKNGGNQKF
ncbi:hypothetical protein CWI39_0786p0010 [Hamiltosporidium magnivora]|uniref:Uncharacterized protein n=1 Tax=Hamiltosporidium magnivora TaxID=148818 RepID=A0A4Q9LA49_9MICR|nr:hypothetical protein CWI39_0786p0010 [Hamiltosporidium magnivora]TBU04623.1 hypothetical protein CWI36_0737p0030 [Hamiltosporidium magnivora]